MLPDIFLSLYMYVNNKVLLCYTTGKYPAGDQVTLTDTVL